MLLPTVEDTIIAVSSGWTPAAVGILRLSGPRAHTLVDAIVVGSHARSDRDATRLFDARIVIDARLTLPATVILFNAPNSYTGQDVAELHTIGCLPALRALSSSLIDCGARRALPGEFTARAFLSGKLSANQVESVLSRINAESAAAARAVARQSHRQPQPGADDLKTHLLEMLALIEAGIDFVEEEDIHLVTPAQVRSAIAKMQTLVNEWRTSAACRVHAGKPHVALAGLPNAGKSTLFNALIGQTRAIVSPVIGTTRDVISAEIDLGVPIVLQDCAGVGLDSDDLEAAAHLAAEQTAVHADIVLWVHDRTCAWDQHETRVCRSIPSAERILVRTKLDLAPKHTAHGVGFDHVTDVSCATGAGLDGLRSLIERKLDSTLRRSGASADDEMLGQLEQCLIRAMALVTNSLSDIFPSELVALELRLALETLSADTAPALPDEVLGLIFTQFCVGK